MKRPFPSQSGYTLLELLIAMTLAVVLMTILFAALRLGYRSQEKGSARAELAQKIRILEDRMSWLIRGAYPYVATTLDGKVLYFQGEADKIGLVTTSIDKFGKGPEDRAGLKWVAAYVTSKGLMFREKVFFLEDIFEDEGGTEYLLDPDVKKLELEYFDVSEDNEEGEWIDEWDSEEKDYLPSAVKFKFTIEVKGREIELPETIVKISMIRKTPKPGK